MDKSTVWQMFDAISPSYDLVNRLLSLGIDKGWRKRCSEFVPQRGGLHLLDLATGTGDQIFAMMDRCSNIKRAVGIDLSRDMLKVGRAKLAKKPYQHLVELIDGSALDLPVADGSIDVITMAFGIRNVTDVDQCLKECYRSLSDNGRLILLEFSLPENRFMRKLHLWYLRKIVPTVGGFFSKNREAYEYLNETIEDFPYGSAFAEKMRRAGFSHVSFFPQTFGISTIYVAYR